jgi:hypothetical protein
VGDERLPRRLLDQAAELRALLHEVRARIDDAELRRNPSRWRRQHIEADLIRDCVEAMRSLADQFTEEDVRNEHA